MRKTSSGLILALLICGTAFAAKAAVTNQVPLWFYLTVNLASTNAAHNPFAHTLLDRAAAAGYTGMVLADSFLYLPNCGGANYDKVLQPFLAHASTVGITVVPLIYAFGEKSIIPLNKNYAEPLPVIGAGFTVSEDKQALVFSNSFPALTDCGFENHSGDRFTSWNYQDGVGTRTFADTNVFRSGTCSFRVGLGTGLARVYKTNVPVIPQRQYHVSIWMCTSNFIAGGSPPDVIVTSSASGRYLTYNNGYNSTFNCSSNQPWTQYNFTFNSMTNSRVSILVWGGTVNSGAVWFDDITVEETALVNLVRRTGAPLTIYDAANTNVFYTETNDVNTVSDPAVPNTGYSGQFTPWHTPPTVTLPAGTSLSPGQQLKMDYYAVVPIYASLVGACFTAPGIAEYMVSNITSVAAYFPTNTSFMMNYDENRHLNNCASCQAMGLTAGGLIGWHVGQAVNTIHSVRPDAPVYVWGDMFDPNMNAVPGYYYFCNGPTSGSWTGLPSNVTIMNWNHAGATVTNSLAFFSARGHQQFIAGYYDSGNGTSAASNELRAAQGVAGFQGLMYTTYAGTNGYKQMENYAAAAKAPTVTAAPTNLSVNVGQFASFSVSATAPTPLTFQWQRNGADIADATNASYACLAAAADNGAQIACRVGDYGGWVLTDSATLTVADATTDSDSDGIPDWWMRILFGHPTGRPDDCSRAQDDADGDHATTWQEYMAGTDPTNPASCFGIVGISNAVSLVSAGPVIRWASVTGKFYTLERATNLHLRPPFDFTVLSNLTATPPENTATDTTATGTGPYFYRILVE